MSDKSISMNNDLTLNSEVGRRDMHRLQVSLDVAVEERSSLIEGHILNLSASGLCIRSAKPIRLPEQCTVKFELNGQVIRAAVERMWESNSGTATRITGYQFRQLKGTDYRLLSALPRPPAMIQRRRHERRNEQNRNASQTENMRRSTRRWQLPHFPIYIGGRDIDTGQYDYCVKAEAALTAPNETTSILKALRNGDIPASLTDYVYARYSVGASIHNRAATQAARLAFYEFHSYPLAKKRNIFDSISSLLVSKMKSIIDLLTLEGHPRRLAEWEFSGMAKAFTAETVSFYKTELARTVEKKRGQTESLFLVRKPDGVVCVSPPRNASCSNSLTGALALLGGNTIVVKPPLATPAATMYLWRKIVDEALRTNGAPAGTINIVPGNTQRFINDWIHDENVNDIIYFGESERGMALGAKIFSAGKKPILELSGKDIMLIWKDADLERAADSLIDCFLGSTQICMVPKTALIHTDIFDKFASVMRSRVTSMKFGLPSDPNTVLSPVNKISAFFDFLEEAIKYGGKVLSGGNQVSFDGTESEDGRYVQPTLIALKDSDQLRTLKCVSSETFFPLLPLVRISATSAVDDPDRAILSRMIELSNTNQFGLRISAWTNSNRIIRLFAKSLNHSGLLRINCRHVDFSEVLATHGGPGKTGGPFGELNYFWQKTTHLQGISIGRKAAG